MGGRIHAAQKVVECPVLASRPPAARNRGLLYPQERTFSLPSLTSVVDPGCSLTRGLDVKLSFDVPAGFTVLSAVGAVPSA